MPATATPAGRSQSAPRASDQRPNAGWMIDELIVAASTSAPDHRVGEVEADREERQERGERALGEVRRQMARRERAMPRESTPASTVERYPARGSPPRRRASTGRGIRPRRGGCGLGERVKLRSRALSVSGVGRVRPIPRTGHAFSPLSDSIPPLMQIDVVEAPPGGVEADVLAFAVHDPVRSPAPRRGSTGWSRAVWPT